MKTTGHLHEVGVALVGIADPHFAKIVSTLIDGKSQDVVGGSAVACRERLGGLLKFYYREAA